MKLGFYSMKYDKGLYVVAWVYILLSLNTDVELPAISFCVHSFFTVCVHHVGHINTLAGSSGQLPHCVLVLALQLPPYSQCFKFLKCPRGLSIAYLIATCATQYK